MTINWFPGHMNKARRELAAALARIDVVIAIPAARLPRSSQHPKPPELPGAPPPLPPYRAGSRGGRNIAGASTGRTIAAARGKLACRRFHCQPE